MTSFEVENLFRRVDRAPSASELHFPSSFGRRVGAIDVEIFVCLLCLGKKLGELLAGIMQNKRMGVLVNSWQFSEIWWFI